MPAMGKLSIPALANAVQRLKELGAKIILIADSDGDLNGTYAQLAKGLKYRVDAIIALHPTLEAAWLFRKNQDPKGALTLVLRQKGLENLIDSLDLSALQRRDKGFRKFVETLTGHTHNPSAQPDGYATG
jgi:hypothetical protein